MVFFDVGHSYFSNDFFITSCFVNCTVTEPLEENDLLDETPTSSILPSSCKYLSSDHLVQMLGLIAPLVSERSSSGDRVSRISIIII